MYHPSSKKQVLHREIPQLLQMIPITVSFSLQIQSDKLEKEYQEEVSRLREDKISLSNKLEHTRSLLENLESKYRKDTGALTDKVSVG